MIAARGGFSPFGLAFFLGMVFRNGCAGPDLKKGCSVWSESPPQQHELDFLNVSLPSS